MILGVDSSVVFSVLKAQPLAQAWLDRLEALSFGYDLVICEVAYAELAAACPTHEILRARLDSLAVKFSAMEPHAAYAAGVLFAEYRRRGGPRTAMIPDFLSAAHAQHQTDGLIAADRGYLRSYSSDLRVYGLEPSNGTNS